MEGMIFLALGKNRKIITHGVLTKRLTATHYLCTFLHEPQCSRVTTLDEIQGWNLFQSVEAMNAFVEQINAPAEST